MSNEPGGYALGRRPGLDGLRGVAVLLVVSGHSLGSRNSAGTVGVTLFFALSGFLITRILVEERARTGGINYRGFLVRRIRRLAPALAAFLVVAAVICIVNHFPLTWVVLPAVYATNLAMAAGEPVQLTGHTWSLGLEEQFYLLWPPLVMLALRRRRAPVITLAALVLLVTMWRAVAIGLGWPYLRVGYGPDMRIDAIIAGCLLAFVADRLRHLPSAAAVWAGAVLLALCLPERLETNAAMMPLATVCAAVVVAVAASRTPRVLALGPLTRLGGISYGVYLWHAPAAMARPHGLVMLPVVLTVSIAIAALSWRLVEARFLTYKVPHDVSLDSSASSTQPSAPASPQEGKPAVPARSRIEGAITREHS
ncbi:acyltransferase [Terrabacter sp. NPDC080008]|uniref:acyltransferase family protein n=1 Tax=Terrabacter sp. NPDC080008 TaxID=3155176 RepID=UPI00344C76DA